MGNVIRMKRENQLAIDIAEKLTVVMLKVGKSCFSSMA